MSESTRQEKELVKDLRNIGLRKRVARQVGHAAGNDDAKQDQLVVQVAKALRRAAAQIEATRKGARKGARKPGGHRKAFDFVGPEQHSGPESEAR